MYIEKIKRKENIIAQSTVLCCDAEIKIAVSTTERVILSEAERSRRISRSGSMKEYAVNFINMNR